MLGGLFIVHYKVPMSYLKGAKKKYRAGSKAVMYFDLIATDTDYSFLPDGERLNPSYAEDKGCIISFVMPEHDVQFEVTSRSSMEYQETQMQ